MSTSPRADGAVDAGRAWLATLPRTATAHAERGDDPQAAVRALLGALGNPQHGLPVIHIAGSKGKGSTALYCEALLRRLGLRTLTYTSPHLQRWTERLRVDGREGDAVASLRCLEEVRAAATDTGVVPGFFEALTVAALVLAARERVDCAIVEAGVGGRADATNVVEPAATILTGIELEHTDRLGDTLEEITREKAGIIKPGAPAITAALPPALASMVRAAAARAGTDLTEVAAASAPVQTAPGAGRVAWHREGAELTIAGPGWSVRGALAAPGEHNAANAALALAAIARLGLVAADDLARAAHVLGETELPGRAETVSPRAPWVVVDGAHTRASMRVLAETVGALAPARLHLLLSVSHGKDASALLDPLLAVADAATTTQADPDYSLDAATLAEIVRFAAPGLAVTAYGDPDDALAHAGADADEGTLVLATGSVYLAGRVRSAFTRRHEAG